MARYMTSLGEISKKEAPRMKRGRKKPAVGQEAAEAQAAEETQEQRVAKALREELSHFVGVTAVRATGLVNEMTGSTLPLNFMNMRTLAAALEMLRLIQEELRKQGNVERDWLDLPPFNLFLARDDYSEAEKEAVWAKSMSELYKKIHVAAGERRDEIEAHHREGVVRYMTLVANWRAIRQLGILLTKAKMSQRDVARVLRSVEMSGLPLYILPPEELASLVRAMEAAGGDADKAERSADFGPTERTFLASLATYWLPKPKSGK